MIVNIFGCLIDWVLTRTWRIIFLFFSLPALIVLGVATLTILGAVKNPDRLAGGYLALGEQELSSVTENWEFAPSTPDNPVAIPRFTEALFLRARALKSDDYRTVFVIAAMMGRRGLFAEAMSLMKQIAPDEKPGFVPGHAWLAFMYLSRPIPEDQVAQFRHHLDLGVQWKSAPVSLMVAATKIALQEGKQREALALLTKSAETQLDLEADVFRLALALENTRVAEQTAEKSLPRLLKAIENGNATSADRVALANILAYRKDMKAAANVLIDGLALNPNDDDRKHLSRALSELYRVAFSQSSKTTDGNWTGNLKLLYEAMKADPSNPSIAEEIAKLARISGEDPPQVFMNQLNGFLASGQATAITHAWLAEAHILRKEFEPAIEHLTNVVTREPNASDYRNNLAYALALHAPDRMQDALGHAQKAIAISPNTPEFHDTLGYILLKLNRPTESIAEFELAIELAPNRIDFRESLIEAYRETGNTSMVAIHERFIEKFRVKQDEAPEKTQVP